MKPPINRPVDITAPPPMSDEQRARVSHERMREIEQQCELEIQVELDKAAEDAYRREARRKIRLTSVPEEQLVDVYIDLPPEQALYLLTNGVMFVAGQTYQVTKDVYNDLRSRMWRAWWNESQRWDNTRENMYRNKLGTQINSKGQAMNAGWYGSQGFGAEMRRGSNG